MEQQVLELLLSAENEEVLSPLWHAASTLQETEPMLLLPPLATSFLINTPLPRPSPNNIDPFEPLRSFFTMNHVDSLGLRERVLLSPSSTRTMRARFEGVSAAADGRLDDLATSLGLLRLHLADEPTELARAETELLEAAAYAGRWEVLCALVRRAGVATSRGGAAVSAALATGQSELAHALHDELGLPVTTGALIAAASTGAGQDLLWASAIVTAARPNGNSSTAMTKNATTIRLSKPWRKAR